MNVRAENNIPINQIICGDCLEVMKDWPDKCVDLCLIDPPYGEKITRKANQYGSCSHLSRKATFEKWDDEILKPETLREILRVSKNQIIFGGNYYLDILGNCRCYIIWDKRDLMPEVPFADTEFAWTSFHSRKPKKYTLLNHGFITDVKDEKSGHPTQKPLKLMTWILQDFSNEDDLIGDFTCGSGTTCVAAKMLGRRYIGIDISPEYCKIAEERLRAVDTGVPVKEARAGQKALFE